MPASTDPLTATLDRLEAALPTLPSTAVAVGRATFRRSNDIACTTIRSVADSLGTVAGVASDATRTVTGQARAATSRSADVAATGARTVAGEARDAAGRSADVVATGARTVRGQGGAQARRVAEIAEDEAEELLDAAEQAIDSHVPLEDLTKAELYERAQERDIDGRSTMSKRELVAALRSDEA